MVVQKKRQWSILRMSEWEEFSAYRNLIADAKREERERILNIIAHASHRYDENTPCPCGAPSAEQYDYIEDLINSSINETIGTK